MDKQLQQQILNLQLEINYFQRKLQELLFANGIDGKKLDVQIVEVEQPKTNAPTVDGV